jgi:IS5 family transposase
MRRQPGFFHIDDRLKRLSDLGDQLETFRSAVDSRPWVAFAP